MTTKTNLCIKSTIALIFILKLTLASAQSQKLPPQITEPVHLKLKDETFEKIVSILSAQLGRGVVADGVPYQKKITLVYNGPGSGALDIVCKRFGYRWKIGKSGGLLLNKSFDVKDDLPQFIPGEMLEMIKDMKRAINSLEYERDYFAASQTTKSQYLFDALTDGNVKMLTNGSQIPFRTLSPEAHAALWKGVQTKYLSPANYNLSYLHDRLVNFNKGKILLKEFTSKIYNKAADKTYETPFWRFVYSTTNSDKQAVDFLLMSWEKNAGETVEDALRRASSRSEEK